MTEDTNKETLDQDSPEPVNPDSESPAEEVPAEASAGDPAPDATEEAASDGGQSPWESGKAAEEEIAELKDKLLRSLAETKTRSAARAAIERTRQNTRRQLRP